MTIDNPRPVALVPILMALIVCSYLQSFFIQPSYAAPQEAGIRTLSIKVHLDDSVVEQGKRQTIHFQLVDQKSHLPISAALTSATVSYADGKTVRQFSVLTNEEGRSSISWKIERNAPLGRYDLVYSASQVGYVPESFVGFFNVVAAAGMNVCLSSSSSSFDSASLVLDTAGQSTNSVSNQPSQTCSSINTDQSTQTASPQLPNTSQAGILQSENKLFSSTQLPNTSQAGILPAENKLFSSTQLPNTSQAGILPAENKLISNTK